MKKDLNKKISSSEEKKLLTKSGTDYNQFWNGIIEKNKPKVNGRIQKLVAFSTWWNKDLAITVSDKVNNQHQVNLLIYEKSWGNIPARLKSNFIGDYSNLEEAKAKIQKVINKLNSDIPILYKYLSIKLKYDEDYFFPETELTELALPNSDITNYPDKYIKPFDIVRIHGGTYFHTGIYLGNGKVCHIHSSKIASQAVIKEETGVEDTSGYDYDDYEIIKGSEGGMVGITNWKNFLKFMGNNPDKVSYLHLFIPYKRQEWIVEDIARSIEGALSYFSESKRGKYSAKLVANRSDSNNCEHYANGIIHGIFVSNYGEKYKVDKKVLIDRKPIGRRIKKYTDVKKAIEENRKFFQSLTIKKEEIERITNLVNEYAGSANQLLGTYKAAYVEVCDKNFKCKL